MVSSSSREREHEVGFAEEMHRKLEEGEEEQHSQQLQVEEEEEEEEGEGEGEGEDVFRAPHCSFKNLRSLMYKCANLGSRIASEK